MKDDPRVKDPYTSVYRWNPIRKRWQYWAGDMWTNSGYLHNKKEGYKILRFKLIVTYKTTWCEQEWGMLP